MLKAVIIDDEILAIELLELLLNGLPDMNVVGTFTNGQTGLAQLQELQPDVVFLDIEMPGNNGLELAERITARQDDIEIVFVTAYNQYALKAFEVNAIDYLLKPIEVDRLIQTVQRISKRRNFSEKALSPKPLKVQFMKQFVLYDHNGDPVKWRTKKVKELCAYLLHHHNKAILKDQIIDDLWPDFPIDKAKVHLHTSMYKLRKELDKLGYPDAIQYNNEQYILSVDVHHDVSQIENFLNDMELTDEAIGSLLNIYIRDYLELDDYFWALKQKKQLRTSFVAVLERFVTKSMVNKNDSQTAFLCLDRLIEIEPLAENNINLAMEYYYAHNKVKEATQIYRNFETLLMDELNEQPSEETKQLYNKFSQKTG